MIDPLAEVVTLLQPAAPFSKNVTCAGHWQVRRSEYGRPFFCVVVEGSCQLAVDGHEPLILKESDFVLIPSAEGFTMSGLEQVPPEHIDPLIVPLPSGEVRCGLQSGPPDVRMLVGYCAFGSSDASLLVSLLPQLVHVRGEKRLTTLVQLVADESRAMRPARDLILPRLLEVLLIEVFRFTPKTASSPGLLNGLADERLAVALRRMHESPSKSWTMAELAREAALSRSAFFERFSRAVGMTPMDYLLSWRMALAKKLLREKDAAVAEVAERVGYSSASTFSVAFARHVGIPPARYAREREQL
ncbi:AraC family transcriptional regulator [Hahella sp. CCB-MM4]|uniref:AraC family transcriptional regulator n=1 Tax=Hahella sp. (strain CCB-MM4) TaxID=1926491 RepID=UPI000B9A40DA|nr:AraC family transcriptional regulator [Hahella sp. CCB-MM4]OZG70143.1 AraC family transcriptional regulator [Hahella sp. CCB-MM4]